MEGIAPCLCQGVVNPERVKGKVVTYEWLLILDGLCHKTKHAGGSATLRDTWLIIAERRLAGGRPR